MGSTLTASSSTARAASTGPASLQPRGGPVVTPAWLRSRAPAGRQCASSLRMAAGKRNFGEKLGAELLDVVTGGPKMRKWYGQESNAVPRDGGEEQAPQQQPQEAPSKQPQPQPQQPEAYSGPRDVVLVMDADTPTGELVTLQLILRAKVRVLVRDTTAAKNGYGPYVEPVSVDTNSQGGLARALQGVKTVIAVGKLGALLPAAQQAGVERLVLLSTAGMPQKGGVAALFQDAADACLKDSSREAAVSGSSLPHVIVKAGIVEDVPGGARSLAVAPSATAAAGGSSSSSSSSRSSVSREDLASALVAAATCLPSFGSSSSTQQQLVFEVRDAGPGTPPADWERLLTSVAAASRSVVA